MADPDHPGREQGRQEEGDVDGYTTGQLPMFWSSLPGLKRIVRPGGNAHFLAGPRIAADSALPRFHLENPEPAWLEVKEIELK